MRNKSLKQHWEEIYRAKDTTSEVSWYQDNPQNSVDLILSTGVGKRGNIIDVGGGDSKLADQLLVLGFQNLFVLDIAATALTNAKSRLGSMADSVTWIETDILEFKTDTHFDVWHDRATFHFLTKKKDITNYVGIASRFISPGGYLIISTFSTNGPKKCSGLDIVQYSKISIIKTFGEKFHHIKSFEQIHTTPFGTKQAFLWNIFRRLG
jgi:ubiquinone/menaquinone biosynthesis C-methylase UbiE